VPNGTEVRVVNQPYVFGWKAGHLYLQSAGPLEDDKRPWKKQARPLLTATLTRDQRKDLKQLDEKIDWARVAQLVDTPAGVPIPVSGSGQGSDDGGNGLEQVTASARLVQNTLPSGSTWDGKSDLPMSDDDFNKMFSGTDHGASGAAAPAAPAAPAASGAGAAARPAADPGHSAATTPAADPTGG